MKFSEINIEGLRGVGNVELRLDQNQRVYTLFGANGVGKTKCLEAVFFCTLFLNTGFLSFASSVGQSVRRGTATMTRLMLNGKEALKSQDVHGQSHISLTHLFKLNQQLLHEIPIVYLGASQRSSIEVLGTTNTQLGDFQHRRKNAMQLIALAMSQGELASLGMSEKLRSWVIARAQSVNPYQQLSDNRKIEIDSLLELLHGLDDRIDPTFLQIDGENQVFLKVAGDTRELGQLSSGFASAVKIMQAIISGYSAFTNETNLTHVRGIVFIDEIESHLHLEWQSKIVVLLKKMLPNTTFFIATHSPLVLTQLEEGEAYQLVRDPSDGVVRSHMIKSPNKQAMVDILREGFGIDLNALKRERMSADGQQAAKARLLNLLNDDGAGS